MIKLGALGDMILAFGPMAAIRAHHPDAHISLLTIAGLAEMAERSGLFNQVLIDPRPKFTQPLQWLRLRKMLTAPRFDRVYDLQTNDRTALYYHLFWPFWRDSVRPQWCGTAAGADFCDEDPLRMDKHALERMQDGLKIAGIREFPPPHLDWLRADVTQLRPEGRFILLVTGSAPTRPEKRWPHYAALARIMLEQGFTPVLIGGKAELDLNRAIAADAPGCVDVTGRTSLYEIAGLGRLASGAIGNDTGPMHILAATGCPTLTLFSAASRPEQSRPRGMHTAIMRRVELKDLPASEVWPVAQGLIQEYMGA